MKTIKSFKIVEIGNPQEEIYASLVDKVQHISIGKSENSDIILDNPAIDDIHGFFHIENDSVFYEDFSSRYGSIILIPEILEKNVNNVKVYGLFKGERVHFHVHSSRTENLNTEKSSIVELAKISYLYLP